METAIATGLITAAALLISQLIVALSPRWNVGSEVSKQDSIESSQSRRKVYAEFMTAIFSELDKATGGGNGKRRSDQELLKVFRKFRTQVLLVGSDEIVRQFNDLDIYSMDPQDPDAGRDLMAGIADLVVAMRRDMGYPKTDIKRIEILAVFLSDAETIEAAMAIPRERRFANTQSL
ncbi:MAG: hypothetical protein OXH07_09835 [Chloroflexi bacterium]|nr:hypothetical protein [Chloroflexota bacterium]